MEKQQNDWFDEKIEKAKLIKSPVCAAFELGYILRQLQCVQNADIDLDVIMLTDDIKCYVADLSDNL